MTEHPVGNRTVFLNGAFVPYEEARVPVEDRGYLFGDGIYEVIRYYGGKPFEMTAHLARLSRSAAGIELDLSPVLDDERILGIAGELMAQNGLASAPVADLYLQVTRAVAPRNHAFPEGATPGVLMMAKPGRERDATLAEKGCDVITAPDIRWGRCDVKSLNLLPNCLAKEQAHRAGAYEALLVRDGDIVSEGSSSNVFAVVNEALVTPPLDNILPGITRQAVIRFAAGLGLPVSERPLPLGELLAGQEAFLTGTTTEVMPIARVNGQSIGVGRMGQVTARVYQAFAAATRVGR